MVTLVGVQNSFSNALKDLLELEYDAAGAYELAIEKLQTEKYRDKMTEFLHDHNRHIGYLINFLKSKNISYPTGGDIIKSRLTKLKVELGSFTSSDVNILRAMFDNEKDTNVAYERMVNHLAKTNDIADFLANAFIDEKKHKLWLETAINSDSA